MLIYSITFNNKLIYIGQTKLSLDKRVLNYKRALKDLKKKTYVINHLRKHGIENHIFSLIDTCNSFEDLNQKEIFYIAKFNTLYPNGLNLTLGGNAPIFSEETKQKMSRARMGKAPWNKGTKGLMGVHWSNGLKLGPHSEESKNKRKRFGPKNHFFGKTHTTETLTKISTKLKGRMAWNRKFVKIQQLCGKTRKVIRIFEDKQEAVRQGFDIACINRCLRLPHLKHKGFYFLEMK